VSKGNNIRGIAKQVQRSRREVSEAFLKRTFADKYDFSPDGPEHFRETPVRFMRMLEELTTPKPFEFTTFESHGDEMVVVQDIPFHSLCAHHIVPFVGVCHIAYIPNARIAGLSKFARLVQSEAATLTVQEELTDAIATFLERELRPLGIGVIMRAEHMCMTLRGAQAPGTLTTTSAMRGVFLDATKGARQEFMHIALGQKGSV
jgi:GTP cyclohydrolase I